MFINLFFDINLSIYIVIGLTTVLIPSKGEIIEYDKEKVYEKLGVYPSQVIDYKALLRPSPKRLIYFAEV